MQVFGTFRSISCSMAFSCIAPLTPAVIVTKGLIFHPLLFSAAISGSYLVCLCMRAWSENL